ncbi:MAG: asparagine synthase-related protein [Hyphomonadaceae bacterium]
MSAIAGLLRLDGGDVRQATIDAALQALAHRIRGQSQIWTSGNVGFGGDDLLVAERAPGPLVIACDARLDNRAELCAELGLSMGEANKEVILAAYARWGDDCPAHLLGDFAFAIWDSPHRRLFCARDQVGVRPFCYALSDRQFAFASEPKGVEVGGSNQEIDPARIAGYLMAIAPDPTSTWRPGVKRLPPGHWLKVERGQLEVQSYWRPSAPSALRDGEVVEAFRALLDEAVKCRLSGETGAMLSGGLDSSAIAVLAQRSQERTLRTFSMVFSGHADERPQIDQILGAGKFDPHFIDMSAVGPFEAFGKALAEQDGPFLAPGLEGCRRLYASAADSGATALLDGHGGDEVVSHGLGRLKHLATTGRWRTLWRNAPAEADLYQTSRLALFFTYWRYFGPMRGIIRKLGSGGAAQWDPVHCLDPELAATTGARELRARELDGRRAYRTEIDQHVAALNAPIQPHALEVLDQASSHAGIEARYPFWDRRLIEFCLALRPEDKLNDGWTRYTLRRAMRGIAPDEIAWRRDKFNFVSRLAEAMCLRHQALMDDIILSPSSVLAGYADLGVLRSVYAKMKASPVRAPGVEVQAIWRSIALAIWLEGLKAQRGAGNGRGSVRPLMTQEAGGG